ncbi:MAG: hypothetical protein ABSF44_15650 [Candidatus Bathyarchaeia archaeon]
MILKFENNWDFLGSSRKFAVAEAKAQTAQVRSPAMNIDTSTTKSKEDGIVFTETPVWQVVKTQPKGLSKIDNPKVRISNPFLGIAVYSLMDALEFFQKEDKRHRLGIIIMADLSVEYTLKAKLYQLKPAKYIESQQERLDYGEAMKQLEENKVAISNDEKIYLAKVHGVRNFAQHRGAIPDSLSTCEYLKWVCRFVERFVKDNFSLDIKQVVSIDLKETLLQLLRDQ